MKRRGYIIAAKKKENDDELMVQVLKMLEEPIKVIKLGHDPGNGSENKNLREN
jgi:hypothetical protein